MYTFCTSIIHHWPNLNYNMFLHHPTTMFYSYPYINYFPIQSLIGNQTTFCSHVLLSFKKFQFNVMNTFLQVIKLHSFFLEFQLLFYNEFIDWQKCMFHQYLGAPLLNVKTIIISLWLLVNTYLCVILWRVYSCYGMG